MSPRVASLCLASFLVVGCEATIVGTSQDAAPDTVFDDGSPADATPRDVANDVDAPTLDVFDVTPSDVTPSDVTSFDVMPDVSSPDVTPDVSPPDATPDVTPDATPDRPDVVMCGDVSRDVRNCGSCGNVCPTRAGFSASCVAGVCASTACGPTDCDGDPANGREVDTLTDACNCGACGRRCEALPGVNTSRCEGCVCRFTCYASFADCDGDPSNGCEVRLTTSATNCGACGRACAGGQTCRGGACVDVPGYTNCGGVMVNLASDIGHCGACGRACAATQVCDRGVCAAACAGGSIRCGMETCIELGSNPLHCGACGSQCAFGQACSFGRCLLGCSAGTIVCDGACVNIMTDNSNCGGCGQTCPAGVVCTMGACQSRMCR